ncbi:MAG: potassium channel family protein, partial [Deltaproteobacteria bacterium]|nr:potassium channel family protein [Deltaproteobacteria bacterium]
MMKESDYKRAYQSQSVRIARIVLLLLAVGTIGTLGYHYLMGWTFNESLYMTVITLTTVGFSEVRELGEEGRLFTIGLVLTGVGIVAYSITNLAAMVMETEFSQVLWRRRMEKKIKGMKNHFVVCGHGRTGRAVCESLARAKEPYVVIESRGESLGELTARGMLVVDGDATQDESLERAGIGHAKALIAALGNDAENVYLTMSARQLNPRLKIASWASSQEAETKIYRAGADYVVSPYLLGGNRLVQHLITPHALAFLDRAIRGEDANIILQEVHIPVASPFIGNSLNGLG